ncbi:DUF4358 domain-containing protein [Muricomes intestini]|jgi:hypothetical protein|uniref:Uncharacterized protein DUF4358 n=1 Tax=Muricomes intestini TaxID=1796634 RepID=A0A4R3K3I6_9FIRM|nr:DUF4358 domain-containing protein [Muricomes intestini]TCS77191.1 uncharacterized protein DUF4358 [Muricomes intestini]HAX51683.1 hypothetical protein [Lachnospiraceae bacterium]
MTEFLKYVTLTVIIGYVVLLIVFTSGSTKPFQEIEQGVENSIDTEKLEKSDMQALKRYYGLNAADYAGVMLYTSESSMSTEEVLLIKVKDDGQMQQLMGTVERRIESRKNDFEGYSPKQMQLLEEAQVSVRGKYLFMAISPRAEEYKAAYMKSL